MTTDEQEIIDGVKEWSAAMLANDADKIGSFMHDDWVIVSERGIATKEHFLSFVRSGILSHERFELIGEPHVKIYGDMAIMTARVASTSVFRGERTDADEFSTDVMVKSDGRWLGVHTHITPANKEFLAMIEKNKGKS